MTKVKCEPAFTQLDKLNVKEERKLTVNGYEVPIINPGYFTDCIEATYSTPNTFGVNGNVTGSFIVGRQIQIDSGQSELNCNKNPEDLTPEDIYTVNKYDYSIIVGVSYDGVLTTVTIADSVLTNDLEEVCLAINFPVEDGMTTLELIGSNKGFPAEAIVKTSGYHTPGDGGGGEWIQNGLFAQTPSQSPSQLGELLLNDAEGNQWRLVYLNTVNSKAVDNSIESCESVSGIRVDLGGQTVNAPLSTISNNYFNGTLNLTDASADFTEQKPQLKEPDYSISRPRTKSPELDWDGKNILWLGTSIPAQGGTDSYPIRFGEILNCNVENMAFAGSHAHYDFNADPFSIGTVKALSMTESDRLWGLSTYGPTSAYDDSFDPITKSSQMTADFRIKNKFAEKNKNVVFLDHNHNDRRRNEGVLNPTKRTIVSISTGVTTDITLSDATGITIGNGAALEIDGINNLNFAAARISNVVSNTVTLEYDSSSFTGTFVSGDFIELDRATFYGAWNFLVYYIKNMSVIYGDGDVKIILSGAPSEYTVTNSYDQHIWRSGELIKRVADKWDLSFFDIGFVYAITNHDHPTYFPDITHPSTPGSRSAITNYWVEWAVGGRTTQPNARDFLASNGGPFNSDREAIYNDASESFGTPDFIYTAGSNVINDDFSGGLGDWTLSGTSPVVVAAPWGGGGDAVLCQGTDATNSTMDNFKAFGDDIDFQFDFQMPVVDGLIEQGDPVGTITICQCRVSGAYFQLQLTVRPSSMNIRGVYFKSPNTDLVNLPGVEFPFQSNTRYLIKVELKKSTSSSPANGELIMYIDGEKIFSQGGLDTFNQNPINEFTLQSAMSNVDAFDCYFGNVVVNQLNKNDFTNRFTGSFTAQGGETVTVVNGIITAVA